MVVHMTIYIGVGHHKNQTVLTSAIRAVCAKSHHTEETAEILDCFVLGVLRLVQWPARTHMYIAFSTFTTWGCY